MAIIIIFFVYYHINRDVVTIELCDKNFDKDHFLENRHRSSHMKVLRDHTSLKSTAIKEIADN